jgi:hypothetical protein
MAQFCIEIPDDQLEEVLNAMGAQYRYQAQVANPSFNSQLEVSESNPLLIDNPEILSVFVNRITREWLENNVKAYNAKVASAAAKQAAIDATNLNITDPQV